MPQAPSRLPTHVGATLVVSAIIVAAVSGFGSGLFASAVIALAAIIPAAIGMWRGMQESTQTGLAGAVLVFLTALGVAGLLVILWIVHWLR